MARTSSENRQLEKDAPERRRVQGTELGRVIAFPEVRGLHHRYERVAA